MRLMLREPLVNEGKSAEGHRGFHAKSSRSLLKVPPHLKIDCYHPSNVLVLTFVKCSKTSMVTCGVVTQIGDLIPNSARTSHTCCWSPGKVLCR